MQMCKPDTRADRSYQVLESRECGRVNVGALTVTLDMSAWVGARASQLPSLRAILVCPFILQVCVRLRGQQPQMRPRSSL